MLTYYIIKNTLKKLARGINKEKIGGGKMKKTIFIEGMACGHCKAAVEKALGQVEGLKSVEVSLEDKKAIVDLDHDLDNGVLKAAVEEAGYEVVNIQ